MNIGVILYLRYKELSTKRLYTFFAQYVVCIYRYMYRYVAWMEKVEE